MADTQPIDKATISRRQLLIGGATATAVGLGGYGLSRIGLSGLGLSGSSAAHKTETGDGAGAGQLMGTQAEAASHGNGRLVLCTLYGGNDGLNTVVPYLDPAYLPARGAIALDPSTVLPLTEGLALHPSLVNFRTLWDAGHLAIVRGVGYPNPSFSHFQSMDIWQSADPTSDTSTGWIGRWLDATGRDPLRALSVGPTLSLAYQGAKVQASAVTTGSMAFPGSNSLQRRYTSLMKTFRSEPDLLAGVAESGSNLLRISGVVGDALAEVPPLDLTGTIGTGPTAVGNGASGAGPSLAAQLDMVGRLIMAGVPTPVYGVDLNGFDTHADERDTQATLLTQLDQAVSGFVRALAGNDHGRHTVMVIYTEFGRRVAGNASGGTDHGSAGPVFVVGPSVHGGFYGDQPSLTDLDDGNLTYTTDFRSIYATVLDRVVGVDPRVSLSGKWPTLDFV